MQNLDFEKLLFLDIETVPQVAEFNDLDQNSQYLWDKKTQWQRNEMSPEVYYGQRAGILAEFGKIVCISIGMIKLVENNYQLTVKSYANHDEVILLNEFVKTLLKLPKNYLLVAHNGKEFDFPYICRRLLINGIIIPSILDIAGKKPWEISHLDTLELWKFGDYKHFTSLELLAHVFKIPTSKDDIDGSQVAEVYWKDNDLQRIVTYCQKDIMLLANLLLKFANKPIIPPEHVKIVG